MGKRADTSQPANTAAVTRRLEGIDVPGHRHVAGRPDWSSGHAWNIWIYATVDPSGQTPGDSVRDGRCQRAPWVVHLGVQLIPTAGPSMDRSAQDRRGVRDDVR